MYLLRIASLLAFVICAVPNELQAADLIIDEFSVVQNGTSTADGVGILGGERDIIANGVSTATVAGGTLVARLDEGPTRNFVMIIYDGDDNNAGSAAHALDEVDITVGGTKDSFCVDVADIFGTVDMNIRVEEAQGVYREREITLTSAGLIEVPFSTITGNAQVSYSSVEQLSFRFFMDVGEGVEVNSLYTCKAQKSLTSTELLIDSFETDQSGTGTVVGTGILGGERDLIANGMSTGTISGGSLVAALAEGPVSNFTMLIYDGQDNSTSNGYLLGGVDLTVGAANDHFCLQVSGVQGSVELTISIEEESSVNTRYSQFISDVGLIMVPFSSFPPNQNISLSSVELVFFRFVMDVGESITLNRISTCNLRVFDDGFEESI